MMRREPGEILTLKGHTPGAVNGGLRRGEAHDTHEGRRFAGAVGTDQGHDLSFFYVKGDPVKGFDGAVGYVQILD
jgi:hypothetical protein